MSKNYDISKSGAREAEGRPSEASLIFFFNFDRNFCLEKMVRLFWVFFNTVMSIFFLIVDKVYVQVQ